MLKAAALALMHFVIVMLLEIHLAGMVATMLALLPIITLLVTFTSLVTFTGFVTVTFLIVVLATAGRCGGSH